MKIVINTCYGGFGLSREATQYMADHGHTAAKDFLAWEETQKWDYSFSGCERNDPILVEAVELFGKGAAGQYAELRIVEIPDDVEWEITDYDGRESVREPSRSWY